MATIWPGATASAAGAETWASTLPTATGMPSGRPVHAAARALRWPATLPSSPISWSSLSSTNALERRVERGEVVAGGVGAVLADALVAGGAGVAHVGVGELPDDPVGGLDPVLHGGVDLGGLLEQLQALGELPLRGDDAAVAGQPLLAALAGELGDPVGLALRGVVLPELDVGVRLVAQLVGVAQRGAVGEGRHHRARGEVGGDADDVGRVDAGGLHGGRHGGAQHLDVVGGDLQGPVRREAAARARHHRVDDPVGVLQDRGPQLGTVGDPDDEGPTGQGAVVDADDVAVAVADHAGLLRLCPPSPSTGM